MLIHVGPRESAGLAGVSSEAQLGDGWLVCSVLLLVWPKLKLIMSIGRVFLLRQKTPTAHHPKHKHHDHQNHQDHPTSKRSRERFPPGPLRGCCACWLLAVDSWLRGVGCWLLVVYLLLVLVALLVLGLMWATKKTLVLYIILVG